MFLGATKKEGGSNVRVSMAMAVPVTPRGGKRVKGHGLQRKVQLSLWRPRHLAEVKSYIHRKKRRRRRRGGGQVGKTHQPSFFHSSSSSLLKSQAGIGARVETIQAPLAATSCLEPQEFIAAP